MVRKSRQVNRRSAFLIISCTLLVLLALDLAFVPNSDWKKLFGIKSSNLATVLNPAVSYAVGTNPGRVISADFNNDGNKDLAVANFTSNNVSILLGSSNGTYSSATNIAVGSGPNSITSSDFNNDGKLDLAVSVEGTNLIYILLGNGDGTFVVSTSQNVNFYSYSVFAADLNNDGKPDLAIANNSNFWPSSVLLGNGDGTFSAAQSIISVGKQLSIFAADFNNDGKLDLITTNRTNDISILLNNGTGSFGAATNFNVGTSPRYVFASDLNNDGNLDVITTNHDSNNVSVLLGNGNGNFGTTANFNVGNNPSSVFVADFDKDGKKDLIVTNEVDNNVSVLLGDGTGSFGSATSYSVDNFPTSVYSSDLNSDGQLDLVTANSSSNSVSVLLSTPNVGIPPTYFGQPTDFSVGTNPNSITYADFNNDGKLDLATANGGNSASILLGNGSGSFSAQSNIVLGNQAKSIYSTDIDDDGKTDLLIATKDRAVYIWKGNGNGTFSYMTQVGSQSSGSFIGPFTVHSSVVAADFNNDGKKDVASVYSSCSFSCNYYVYVGTNSGGVFLSSTLSLGLGSNPSSIYSADFNNDGKLDIAVANNGTSNLSVFLGNGNGTFSARVDSPAYVLPVKVLSTDFNNDGKQDIAILNGGGTVTVFMGNGSGAFPAGTVINNTGLSSASSFFASDINNDGKQDLIVTNNINNGAFVVLSGDGNGSFSAPIQFVSGNFPSSIISADLNNDGQQDLAISDLSTNKVSVLLGLKPNPIPTTINIDPTSKTAGDSQFTMTVNGTNFMNSSIVKFGGSNRTTTYVSPTQLTVTIPAADLTTSGSFPITVINPVVGSSTFVTIENLSESNLSGGYFNVFGSNWVGQSFSNTDISTLDSVKFYIRKNGSPTGNAYAKLYAISGTYGSNSVPTGSPLATSDPLDVSTLPISLQLTTFNFSGANRITMPANTKYVIVLYYASGSVGNIIDLGSDQTSPTASGNISQTTNGGTSWSGWSGGDLIFYIYGIPAVNESNAQTFTVNNPPPPLFNINPAVNYPAGSFPTALVTADFNTDGKADLALVNSSKLVSLLNGVGDGTFTSQTTTNDLGLNPPYMMTADFNGDGKADIASANFNGNYVSILLGNGSSGFNSAPNIVTNRPGGIFASDFNSDNKLDLAVINGNGANSVSIYSGDGTGGFTLGPTYSTAGSNPQAVFAEDFNGDGKKDLAITNYDGSSVSILTGNGNGTFNPATSFATSYPGRLFVQDFNGDNKQDLAVINRSDNTVSVFLGNGNGTFGTARIFPVGSSPYDIFVSDINNDGNYDIEVTNTNSDTVSVLLGYGNGSFATAVNLGVGQKPKSLVGGDFNSDGFQDLAVVNSNWGGVSILLGINPTPVPTLISISPTSKIAGDSQFVMTVDGTDFVSSSIVQFNGSARATTYVSPTELTAIIPDTDMTTAGSFPIIVVSPGGLTSNPQLFTVNSQAPTITSISPAQKMVGNPLFIMTITGMNFTNSSVVRFEGSDKTTTFVSPTQLTATIPASDMLTDGTFNITVFNPSTSGGDISNNQAFTVIVNPSVPSAPVGSPNPIPVVNEIGPTIKFVGDAGFDLMVNGSNFVGGSVVRFNGSSRETTFISSTQLKAKILNTDLFIPGSYSITVFNPAPGGGISTN